MVVPTQVYGSARPYVRWWWFAGPIHKNDICSQLDWIKQNGFGGVEIAFMYPLKQPAYGPKWLSPELSHLVAHAVNYAGYIGLGCDLTCGTAWPFGGSIVPVQDAARLHDGLSPQRLEKSWEEPVQGYILNHLDRQALKRYMGRITAMVADATQQQPLALFCDSWEVVGNTLWTDGFDTVFFDTFGYDIMEYIDELNDHPDVRYDYRALLARYVLEEFFTPFTKSCHEAGALARVQCHGAPTDLIAAYTCVDVPESEVLLFDPPFSRIAASAAALVQKPLVSAEVFTCLYGWKPYPGPGPLQKREQVADMKLLADSLFAHGVNMIVWHGMPYNSPEGTNQFYASVHVGPDSSFVSDLPGFNAYLEKVCSLMRQGTAYADIAVYLPLEDNWMRNELPEDMKRPSARYFWELQHERIPGETYPFHPLWTSGHVLSRARVEDGMLCCGKARFSCLYVDTGWLDMKNVEVIVCLAKQGLSVCMKTQPRQPGKVADDQYRERIAELFSCETVYTDLAEVVSHPPLVLSDQPVAYWCRKCGEDLVLFAAHPKTSSITYPMKYGQSLCSESEEIRVTFNYNKRRIEHTFVFKPYQSLCVRISSKGAVSAEDITYQPPPPVRSMYTTV